jgi:hypothetical protein
MRNLVFAFAVLMAIPVASFSANPLDARTIVQRVNDRDDGDDSYAKVEMLLTDRSGVTQARSMISATKDFKNLTKSYIRFTAPASIDGTCFLSWQVEGKDDEQFLYLPELGRDRRIASSQKDSDFVNTDFTYEDMQERNVDKDTHKILREEKKNGFNCWVIESVPLDPKSSQYRRWISWIPKDVYIPLRVEYYTRVIRQPTKILTVRRLEKVQDIWTVKEVEMKNSERNTQTILRTTQIKYNDGLPNRMFTRGFLKQTR